MDTQSNIYDIQQQYIRDTGELAQYKSRLESLLENEGNMRKKKFREQVMNTKEYIACYQSRVLSAEFLLKIL